ncbi:glycosyltransferase [Vibrio parahaemolyticus]|uniref:glycosyltransferase n=1 Tax=Vibrio parahaemolyticus TaxID=670 RepID=UPI001A8E0A29|nr:glycosyltransferase [Vibrio parahaemolyticus]EJB8540137.1 glycosyltransferase [Vibrio parahaemolyticus]MBO0186756.1 glycosyltransferase [Vibrio parahaemolyticus]MBO0218249.1 glycosyltransferase [Vibrio parahaemolyticus]MBY4623999.1 glycosyltransferase [Vibrio parahaemolyticus]MCR9736826.1 glycosyltransferase [Vibrio parahaemolyticus]
MIEYLNKPESEDEVKSYWKHTEKIYVSIVCTTYNQRHYITQALDSFLAQKCEYRFEIIVHDDASTDGTREILEEYKLKYPSLFKLVLQTENQYKKGNFRPLYHASSFAEGKYLCFCEGDDFWISDLKIQKQLEALKSDQNISLVHTGAIDLVQATGALTDSDIPCEVNTTDTLFRSNRVRTFTTMFPKVFFDEFHSEHGSEANKWMLGDWPLWIYLSTKGRIILLKQVTGVYRILEESASHSKDKFRLLELYLSVCDMFIYMAPVCDFKELSFRRLANEFVKILLLHNINLLDVKCQRKEALFSASFLGYRILYYINRRVIPLSLFYSEFKKLRK